MNHVRIHKKMTLLRELVGFQVQRVTKEMREWTQSSSIRWKVQFENAIKPNKRLVEEWLKLANWLQNRATISNLMAYT